MELTTLGNYGYLITARDWKEKIDKAHPVIQNIHTRLSYDKFKQTKKPLVIGSVYDTVKFSFAPNHPKGICVIDLPIKVPHSPNGQTYCFPKELDQFSETIARIVSFEHTVNPYSSQYYAYLTVVQGYVNAYKFHRTNGNCMVEGAHHHSLTRVKDLQIPRSYSVYDRMPDIFYCQKFDFSDWDGKLFGLTKMLDGQTIEENAISFDRYSIVASDIYSVSRETTADYPFFRTFLKLSFDTIKHPVITSNPLIEQSA